MEISTAPFRNNSGGATSTKSILASTLQQHGISTLSSNQQKAILTLDLHKPGTVVDYCQNLVKDKTITNVPRGVYALDDDWRIVLQSLHWYANASKEERQARQIEDPCFLRALYSQRVKKLMNTREQLRNLANTARECRIPRAVSPVTGAMQQPYVAEAPEELRDAQVFPVVTRYTVLSEEIQRLSYYQGRKRNRTETQQENNNAQENLAEELELHVFSSEKDINKHLQKGENLKDCSEEPVAPGDCKVMISFNHKSASKYAVRLTHYLNANGIATFCTDVWNPRGQAGQDWQAATDEGAMTCQYFVMCMTNGWQKSIECQDETKNVFQRKKRGEVTMIPVLFPDFDHHYDKNQKQYWISLKFKAIQHVEKVEGDDESWMKEIKDSIRNNQNQGK
mmetsp:Transcript_4421/g.6862  ORF Transcript_4421/g.6862 Transcript_4421/m.6862 type:complete len:395 (+) Transcript_4421:141-1325(+)